MWWPSTGRASDEGGAGGTTKGVLTKTGQDHLFVASRMGSAGLSKQAGEADLSGKFLDDGAERSDMTMTKTEFLALGAVPKDIAKRKARIERLEQIIACAGTVSDTVQSSLDAGNATILGHARGDGR